LQVRVNIGIPITSGRKALSHSRDYRWIGLREAWLAYIRETYPDGPVAAADIMGDSTLEIDE
jgi:hypothetical protein